MRRKDREITDPERISEIIRNCLVCRLGLAKDDMPYIVPVAFGYDGSALYFHTAAVGQKIDYLTANNRVCFEFEHDVRVVAHADSPCQWSFSYQSVIGNGRVDELLHSDERTEGLNQIMAHYSGREWTFARRSLDDIRVWRLTIETISGKESRHKAAN